MWNNFILTARVSFSCELYILIVFLYWQSELNYLGQLHHPNLVKLTGYCLDGDNRLLVYEFMPNGSLENHLFRSMLMPLVGCISFWYTLRVNYMNGYGILNVFFFEPVICAVITMELLIALQREHNYFLGQQESKLQLVLLEVSTSYMTLINKLSTVISRHRIFY